MKKYDNIQLIYFSATNQTKSIIERIASHFDGEVHRIDLLENPIENQEVFDKNSLTIIGMPVYSGRIPNHTVEMLKKVKGQGSPAILFVSYGNRDYDDALLELKDITEQNQFNIIGAGAFIARHSVFFNVAKDRPDQDDLNTIDEFANKCHYRLENFDENSSLELKVKGNYPYKEVQAGPLKPSGDEKCNGCKKCVKICPMEAITQDDPKKTIEEKCISCGACIYACPQKSRMYHSEMYKMAAKGFEEKNSNPRENEYFII